MSSSITRCPKCSTCFRISDSHLNLAKGSVRCGSCLHVFNAKEHLVKSKTAQPEPQPTPETDPDDDLLISDDMEISDTQEGNGLGEQFNTDFNDNILYSSNISKQETNLFEREFKNDDDDDELQSDESWALDLLNNPDKDETQLRKQKTDAEEEAGYFDDADEAYEEHDDIEEEPERHQRITSAFQIIEEEEETDEEIRKVLFGDDDPDFISRPPNDISEITYPTNPGDRMPPSKNTVYLDFEPEPVEMAWKTHNPLWDSKALWGGLSLLAGLLILIQIAWLKFDTLSRVSPYRAYYQTACSIVGCQLPELIDLSRIRTANLVVRSHPSVPRALIVDTVLQNTADFTQPFPTLDLIFTDLNNQIVAARRFAPEEYLGGEMAGKKLMPSKQPVHIAIEIADPGQSAVSYRLTVAH